MKGLREKFRKNAKGFTLIEMLVVVAIIAILVAVSIPLVNMSLDRARSAADQANERAAKAKVMLAYLGMEEYENYEAGNGGFFWYDAQNGILYYGEDNPNAKNIEPYGQNNKGQIIRISILASGKVAPKWMDPPPK